MTSLDSKSYATTEEPDLVIGHYVGHVDADDARRILEAQRVFCEGKSHVFLLADVHRMVNISAEARRASAEPTKSTALIHGIAVVGASFHFRVVGSMLFRAAKVLRRSQDFPVRFFDTHNEARAFFNERRHELGLSLPTNA